MLQKIGYMEEDNIIEKKPWRGIPPEYTDRWREIYNNAAPEEGMHLSDACPVCGDTELYRQLYYVTSDPSFDLLIQVIVVNIFLTDYLICFSFPSFSSFHRFDFNHQ